MTIWRMRIACWINKATNTQSEYVILFAFPLQQWLCERASMLRYTYNACLPVWFFVSFILQNNEMDGISRSGRGLLWRTLPVKLERRSAERLTSDAMRPGVLQLRTVPPNCEHKHTSNQDVYTSNYWKTYASCSCSVVSVFIKQKC